MPIEYSCRKCGRANWKSYWAKLGHEGRCKGIPGLVARVSKIQAAPLPAAPSGSLSGSEGAVPSQPAPLPEPPPEGLEAQAQLLEARISLLEEENRLLKEVVLNDLQHLGQVQTTPSPLPWVLAGGAVVLGGLWLAGIFDAGAEDPRLELGAAEPRPRAGQAFVGGLMNKVAGKLIDRALGKIL